MRKTCSTHLLAPALLLGLLFFGCKKQSSEQPAHTAESAETAIVAVVNGEAIPLSEFEERFTRSGYKATGSGNLSLKKDFLNRLVERKMLLNEARQRGITPQQQELDKRIETIRAEQGKDIRDLVAASGTAFDRWKSDIMEDLMIERLLAEALRNTDTVLVSEIQRYYKSNAGQFKRPIQARARQIVVMSEDEANQLLAKVRAKGADFSAIARAASKGPEAENGGDLGWFAKGEMPSEFNVVFSLPKGGISAVVKSPYGYHIFKLDDKRMAQQVSLKDASAGIAETLKRQQADAHYQQWLANLRARTTFEVHYEILK